STTAGGPLAPHGRRTVLGGGGRGGRPDGSRFATRVPACAGPRQLDRRRGRSWRPGSALGGRGACARGTRCGSRPRCRRDAMTRYGLSMTLRDTVPGAPLPEASTVTSLRQRNRAAALQVILRERETTRAEVARRCGLSAASAANLVAELIADGLAVET